MKISKIIRKKWYCISAFLFLFIATAAISQTLPVALAASAVKNTNVEKGNFAYNDLNYSQAVPFYEAYLKTDPSNKEILSKVADCYWQMRDYPNALRTYQKLYPNGSKGASQVEQFRIGELYARQGDYTTASQWLSELPAYQNKENAYTNEALMKAMQTDTLNWDLGLCSFSTTGYREYCPYLYNDQLLFCSNRPLSTSKTLTGWDASNYSRLWNVGLNQFYTKDVIGSDSIMQQSKAASKNITYKRFAGFYEGADTKISPELISTQMPKISLKSIPSFVGAPIAGLEAIPFNVGGIATDQNGHIYFSANYEGPDENNINRIRLMEALYDGKTISNIRELGFGNKSSYSVMHPAVNKEGTILVFSSNQPGGQGSYDLYYAQRETGNGKWGPAAAFGTNINTVGNEVFPSITPDGELYFSSDGRPGLGGLDIYHIPLTDAINGEGTLRHMTAPINSSADDFGWTQDSIGTQAYFTSDRFTSVDNIYSASVDLKKIIKSIPPTLAGYVKDRQTMTPLAGATVFMYNPCEGNVHVAKTDANGRYSFPVINDCEVALKAINRSSSDCFKMQGTLKPANNVPIEMAPYTLLLDRYPKGLTWKLDNVHYNFNKWNIRADAKPILDSLVAILKAYPIKVELASHCDSRGSFAYNDVLSQKRAESAVRYIVSQGIDPSRITAKGYGKRKIMNKCVTGVPCTSAEHQENRRTEITVIQSSPIYENQTFDPNQFSDGQVLSPKDLPSNFFNDCVKAK